MPDMKTGFKRVDYDPIGLLLSIDIGEIGLPDSQWPFVWPNTKVQIAVRRKLMADVIRQGYLALV